MLSGKCLTWVPIELIAHKLVLHTRGFGRLLNQLSITYDAYKMRFFSESGRMLRTIPTEASDRLDARAGKVLCQMRKQRLDLTHHVASATNEVKMSGRMRPGLRRAVLLHL